MHRDQIIGGLITVASIVAIIVYAWVIFFTKWSLLLMRITAFVAVAAVLGIIAWIGYTLATTPPPKPIEEVEKDLEEELGKIEESGEEQKEKTG